MNPSGSALADPKQMSSERSHEAPRMQRNFITKWTARMPAAIIIIAITGMPTC